MEREVCHLQSSPLMQEKRYVEMIRFIRERCLSDGTIQLPTRVPSARKTLSSEEIFVSSVVSHLLQLQLVLDEDTRKGDLSRIYCWFTANKDLLFPTTKTYQQQVPRMRMGLSTPPPSQTTHAQETAKVKTANTTATTLQLVASDCQIPEESHDCHVVDHSLDHHPRWENTDLSNLTTAALTDWTVLLSEDVGWDLVEEKEAREEWQTGRSDLWTLAKKFHCMHPSEDQELEGEAVRPHPLVDDSILKWIQAAEGEERGENTEPNPQQDDAGTISKCPKPSSFITAGCVPGSTHSVQGKTAAKHPGRPSQGGEGQQQTRPPTTQTLTINTAHAYGCHGDVLPGRHPKKLLPFVAGFKSESYRYCNSKK